MKVVTARASSVTSCEQIVDEELDVGSRLRRAGVPARPKLSQGENRVGGMCFRAGVAVRRAVLVEVRARRATLRAASSGHQQPRDNECGKQKGSRPRATPAKQSKYTGRDVCELGGTSSQQGALGLVEPALNLKSGCGCAPSG